jgi:cation transport ATPase
MATSSPRQAGSSALRLSLGLRVALCVALCELLGSGVGWLAADSLKHGPGGDVWQAAAAYLLMLHGGGGMATLILLGALIPLHVQRAWRNRRNRATGAAMVALHAILIATAFGLYYIGSEMLRAWASALHIAVGLLLPIMALAHLRAGRLAMRGGGGAGLARRAGARATPRAD